MDCDVKKLLGLTQNAMNPETSGCQPRQSQRPIPEQQERPLNPVIVMKRMSVVISFLLAVNLCSLAQNVATPVAGKSAPKTTYILVGRLFDATSDNVREN
jgi:hypothetical protein